MIYITGDIHGNKRRLFEIKYFCEQNHTTLDDYLIVLGDVGINYCKDIRDNILKNIMMESPITFICIRGNHELRPTDVSTYKEKEMFGGIVYQEDEYPNIVFLKDGGEYEINGRKFLAIGGAYSVDKDYRLLNGWNWFSNEQLSLDERNEISKKVNGKKYNYVLTHTCPFEWQPTELFLSSVDQSKVDKSMEIWLGELERTITYDKWYFGHFHGNKNMGKYEMLFEKIKPIDMYIDNNIYVEKIDTADNIVNKNKQKFYTIKNIAEYFKVSQGTVRNWVKKNYLIANKLNSGRYLISEDDLQTFIKEHYHYANNK